MSSIYYGVQNPRTSGSRLKSSFDVIGGKKVLVDAPGKKPLSPPLPMLQPCMEKPIVFVSVRGMPIIDDLQMFTLQICCRVHDCAPASWHHPWHLDCAMIVSSVSEFEGHLNNLF